MSVKGNISMDYIPPVILVPGITGTYLRDEYRLPPDRVWSVLQHDFSRVALHPDDPRYEAVEPARVRAMYTHPNFVRRGIGRLVLSLCETAAAREGFRSLELVATVAGEPLYSAYGFSVIERIEVATSKGVTVPCARMSKQVTATRAN